MCQCNLQVRNRAVSLQSSCSESYLVWTTRGRKFISGKRRLRKAYADAGRKEGNLKMRLVQVQHYLLAPFLEHLQLPLHLARMKPDVKGGWMLFCRGAGVYGSTSAL